MKNRLREIVYRLKQAFGQTITIHEITATSTDYDTGARDVQRTAYAVRRAVVLPADIRRQQKFDIGYLKANSNFVYGGEWVDESRIIIIDRRDCEITLTDKMYILFKHKRYDIKKVAEIEDVAYMIAVVETKGAPPYETHIVHAHNVMEPRHEYET